MTLIGVSTLEHINGDQAQNISRIRITVTSGNFLLSGPFAKVFATGSLLVSGAPEKNDP